MINKQTKELETEIDTLKVKLPRRPPKSVNIFTNTDIWEEQFMFRKIFTNQQFMFDLHMTALKGATTNDRLRQIYKSFLKEELNLFNKLAIYGKLKGWTRPTPMYKTD